MANIFFRLVNVILNPFGARIISTDQDKFTMPLALKRVIDHNIPLKSIIDIGASNGKWSREALYLFSDVSILAIEPLSEREIELSDLKMNRRNFDYSLCVAGERDDDHILINVSEDLDGSTINGVGGEKRSVPIKSIDTLVSENKLQGPFMLKFDTHGFELPILKGASNTLRETNVIIMEVYNFDITDHSLRFPEMCKHLEELGFRCYDIADPMLRKFDNSFWQMDLFFTRSDSSIFSYDQYK